MTELSPEARRLIAEKEPVVWIGRPDGTVWIMAKYVGLVFVALLLATPGIVVTTLGLPGLGVGLIVGAVVLTLLIAWLEYLWLQRILYVFTPRRIIFQRGLIGRDFEIVDFARVTDYSVKVSVWDKLLGRGTGTIRVRTASEGGTSYPAGAAPYSKRIMHNVAGPYEVQSTMLQLRDKARTRVRPDAD